MAVGGVEHKGVHIGSKELLRALQRVRSDANGSCHAQTAAIVLAGVGVLLHIVDVLDGDETAQMLVLVHNQELFDAVFVQMALGFLQGSAHGNGDEVFAGHYLAHQNLGAVFHKAHVPVGQDALQAAVVHDGQAGNAEVVHEIQRFLHCAGGRDGHGIENHAALALLDLFHLKALTRYAHVLVDNANAAHAGHGDGHGRLCHRIHGSREQGRFQLDFGGEPGGDVHHVGGHFRIAGHEKNIVKSQGFAAIAEHACLSRG